MPGVQEGPSVDDRSPGTIRKVDIIVRRDTISYWPMRCVPLTAQRTEIHQHRHWRLSNTQEPLQPVPELLPACRE